MGDTTTPAQANPGIRTPRTVGIRNSLVLAQDCLSAALDADTDDEMQDCVISARYWLNY